MKLFTVSFVSSLHIFLVIFMISSENGKREFIKYGQEGQEILQKV